MERLNIILLRMLALKAVILIVVWTLCDSRIAHLKSQDDTLLLVHVLFRHGNRTANSKAELYPNDPYYEKTYFPIGLGQLTNAGKVREHSIGKYLRSRYDTFLGDSVYPGLVDARSTDYNRTKASLLYCLSGLFPPKDEEVWNLDLEWQAIPTNYWESHEDKVLMGTSCPNYIKIYSEEKYSNQNLEEYAKYSEVFNYISENSGLNVTSFEEIYNLYFGLSTEDEFGLKLPTWLDQVWPDRIIELSNKEYYVATGTTVLKRLSAGYLIKKIIEDSFSKLTEDPDTEFKKKLYLYSAHESNIGHLLVTLGVFDDIIPNYGSFVFFELHDVDGVPGIKILYQNYQEAEPVQLKLPECEDFCPLEQFASLLEKYLPADEECGN